MKRCRQFGHHRLSVFGIMDAEELALVRPVAASLMARDALRADEYGGLSFGPGAKPILKGEAALVIAVPPKREPPQRGAGGADFRTIRCSRRCAAGGASGPRSRACRPMSFSTIRPCARSRLGRPASLRELSAIEGIGDTKLERHGESLLDALAKAMERDDAPAA